MLTFISIFPHFCTVSKSNIIVCSFVYEFSCSVLFVSFIYIVCGCRFYSLAVCVPLCEYTIIYSLSVLDGHLDSFQCLTIMCCYEHSRTCLFANINMHIFLLYIHVCNYRVIGLSYIQLCKYCQIILQSVLVYKTTNSVWELQLLHILSNTWLFCSGDFKNFFSF